MMRLSILTFLAWIVAVFVSLVAWGIGLNALGTTLQDMRPYQINLPEGWVRHPEDTWKCPYAIVSSAYIVGESYWLYPCLYERQNNVEDTELFAVRVSPATGQMDWLWRIPGEFDSSLAINISDPIFDHAVFVPNADGRLFLYANKRDIDAPTDKPEQHSHLLYPDGRVEVVPLSAGEYQTLRGAAWVEDAIQVVSVSRQDDVAETKYGPATLSSWSAATGTSSKVVPQPEGCANCRLQIAYRLETGWRLIYADMEQIEIANSDRPGIATYDSLPLTALYMTDETGARLPLELPTNRIDEPDSDTLIWFPNLFDSSLANVSYPLNETESLRVGAVPYYFTGDGWALTATPPQPLLDAFSAGRLLFMEQSPRQFQTGTPIGSWSTTYVSQRLEGMAIAHLNGQWVGYRYQEPLLSFATESQPQARHVGIGGWRLMFDRDDMYIIPQADGGYWLATVGALSGGLDNTEFYLDIGPNLERRNTPNIIERIAWRFGDYAINPSRLWVRLTAFLLPLIGLPLLLIGGLVLRRRVVRRWVSVLLVIYIVLLILTQQSLRDFFGIRF